MNILEILLQDGCRVANFAAVSREWQPIIEQHNFARIYLTRSRLENFRETIHRNRALVHYIWLCVELDEYDCTECGHLNTSTSRSGSKDSIPLTAAFKRLFATLSTWEPNGNLLLDISVHSPSDSQHWFKYLTFEPDLPFDERNQNWCAETAMLEKLDDHNHDWCAGRRKSPPKRIAIEKVFEGITGGGPFDGEEFYTPVWRDLPLAPAVTGLLLRQQTRRQWWAKALDQLLSRLPGLQEIHYEPWREWSRHMQAGADHSFPRLLKWFASSHVRRLVLFENFDPQYTLRLSECDPVRIPAPNVAEAIACASLALEQLSASFMVDAADFFCAREPSWEWPNLTSMALTTRLLAPDTSANAIDGMLLAAAAAAINMPNLKTMELWNAQAGLAMLFRYESTGNGLPAVLTLRGTWEFELRPRVAQAWEAVARKPRGQGSVIVKELVGIGVVRWSHGDAIHHLKLLNPVVRPVSLWQIRMEHRLRDGCTRLE
ncbi:hypothetical protein SPI_07305 [Niveomyces insectorum RCEF 264]|uniref:DUF6546 domain-containing protein n=1 Tax=Niveomyces insectorum RCEF 264 TaxID=1081102 RepID=A0A167QHF1_9HYPO|nr:hypothetical protein SPI_07305 [Niveomyces insectorum RCEF 264]